MIALIIKSGLCMVLLFGLYWLLLRKEKLFTFNRYYLIFSILFSLTVPFISIPVKTGFNNENTTDIAALLDNIREPLALEDVVVVLPRENAEPARPEINSGAEHPGKKSAAKGSSNVFLLLYFSGLLLMLFRFLRNIIMVKNMCSRSEKIDNDWYRIALLDHPVNPFSFLRTVFLNKQDYLKQRISENVLKHELEHVRQAHSCDIIFFEIIHIIFWFNPLLFLFKQAARINHEYLADEAVIRSVPDRSSYAGELINYISRMKNVTFASGFSPSMIRLRLLMLNSDTSRLGKTTRMLATLFTSVLLMSFLSIRPGNFDPGNSDRKRFPQNKNIVIEEVHFMDPDFSRRKCLLIFNGRELGADEMITINPQQIKTIEIVTGRKAIRKFGKNAKDGAVEISMYGYNKRTVPDSLNFKSVYTVNDRLPEGSISIPVSNLRSLKIWNYPLLPNQTIKQHWRTVEFMTKDFYRISGMVLQKNGEPLSGALVRPSEKPAKSTGNDGRFLLEDVNAGALVELSAEGYEQLTFKATDFVFRNDLNITLEKKDEPDPDMIISNAGNEIVDFSGAWKVNYELSRSMWPKDRTEINYIHQFGSDSIMIRTLITLGDGKKLDRNMTYVFNNAEKMLHMDGNFITVTSCKIAPDGRSFSLARKSKGIFESKERYRSLTIFSLNNEGSQITRRDIDFREGSSETGEEIQSLVFDKM